MAVVYRCVGILTVDVVGFFRSPGVFHSQDSFPSTFRPRLWETSSGMVAIGVFAAEARSSRHCALNAIKYVQLVLTFYKGYPESKERLRIQSAYLFFAADH